MSSVVELLLDIPENIAKSLFPSRHHNAGENNASSGGGFPVDILDTPKEYIFFMDVPGLSKSDIQVTVEDETTLVIKSGGNNKRKREEEEEEEGCKHIRLERKVAAPRKLMRKFRLPENANAAAVTAKCENGVLTVVVEKHPPPAGPKTVKINVS